LAPIKTIGIFCKHKPPVKKKVLEDIVLWLEDQGFNIVLEEEAASIMRRGNGYDPAKIPDLADLIIVLGGDGTLLGVARLSVRHDVLILPVNLGTLGFLAEISFPNFRNEFNKLRDGVYQVENRMLLNATQFRNGNNIGEFHAMNEVSLIKGIDSGIIDLEVNINNKYMTSYRADGLIVATPTGSTAYSLSAGGPILHPSMNAMVLSPICPFALTNRPVVIPDGSELAVQLAYEGSTMRCVLDGQEGTPMKYGDILKIKKADTPVKIVQLSGKNFYQVLREKLHWGAKPENGMRFKNSEE
jgi:NAD+ kinase